MSITVNTNVQSLFAQRALGKNTMGMQKSLEKLSTGFRINRAGDDAAGLSISEGLTSEIRGLQKAKQNIGDGVSAIQTAEGALSVVQDNFQRIRELMVQAENGTNSADELDALQREINERVRTIDDVAQASQFNGRTLLTSNTAAAADVTIQTGANNGETASLVLRAGQTANTGMDLSVTTELNTASTTGTMGFLVEGLTTDGFSIDEIHLSGATGVDSVGGSGNNTTISLDEMDTIIGNVSRMRSYLGAMQNSLESRSEYVDVAIENASASRSRIKDVDVASESSVMLKNQILQQSAASMLSQANSTPQIAMNLLP